MFGKEMNNEKKWEFSFIFSRSQAPDWERTCHLKLCFPKRGLASRAMHSQTEFGNDGTKAFYGLLKKRFFGSVAKQIFFHIT